MPGSFWNGDAEIVSYDNETRTVTIRFYNMRWTCPTCPEPDKYDAYIVYTNGSNLNGSVKRQLTPPEDTTTVTLPFFPDPTDYTFSWKDCVNCDTAPISGGPVHFDPTPEYMKALKLTLKDTLNTGSDWSADVTECVKDLVSHVNNLKAYLTGEHTILKITSNNPIKTGLECSKYDVQGYYVYGKARVVVKVPVGADTGWLKELIVPALLHIQADLILDAHPQSDTVGTGEDIAINVSVVLPNAYQIEYPNGTPQGFPHVKISVIDSNGNEVATTTVSGVSASTKTATLRFKAPSTPGTYTYTVRARYVGTY